MPVPNEEQGGGAPADEKDSVDIFGDEPEEATEQAPEEEGDDTTKDDKKGGEDKKKGDKGDDDDTEDDDDNPVVQALKESNKVKDDSIRAMRRRIKELEKGGGKASDAEVDLPYKSIQWSKDLSEDERDSMTETEIKQMDQIAEMQQRINDDVQKAHDAEVKKAEEADEDDDDDWDTGEKLDKGEAKKFAKSEALKLAGGDKDVANEILQEYNLFNNEGLTDSQIKERLEKANKLRPDYQPPKMQKKKTGKAAKGNAAADPFGVDTIVEQAAGGDNKETYDL